MACGPRRRSTGLLTSGILSPCVGAAGLTSCRASRQERIKASKCRSCVRRRPCNPAEASKPASSLRGAPHPIEAGDISRLTGAAISQGITVDAVCLSGQLVRGERVPPVRPILESSLATDKGSDGS